MIRMSSEHASKPTPLHTALCDLQANLSQLSDLALRLTLFPIAGHSFNHTLIPLFHSQANLSQLSDLTLRLAFCLMIDGQAPLYGLWCSYVQSYLPQGVRC